MINEENKTELIEHYLLGTLKGQDLNEFIKKLTQDENFYSEMEIQKKIISAMPSVARAKLRDKLKAFHTEISDDELHTKKTVNLWSKRSLKTTLAIAASLISILVCSLIVQHLNEKQPQIILFEQYYEPYSNIVSASDRGTNDQVNTSKNKAFMAYEKGDFSTSTHLFEDIWKKEKDEAVLFYLGNSYLGNGNTSKAIEIFKNYLIHYKTFENEARWYLALCYLKENNLGEALPILRILAKSENDFSRKSKEILKDL